VCSTPATKLPRFDAREEYHPTLPLDPFDEELAGPAPPRISLRFAAPVATTTGIGSLASHAAITAQRCARVAGAEVHRGDLESLETLANGARSADAVIHLAFDLDFAGLAENGEVERRAIRALGDSIVAI
jgi:hypothetical protein